MLKKATIEDVTQYLQKFYLKNRINLQERDPKSNQQVSYFHVINKFYNEFSNEFSFNFDKNINKYFYDFFEKDFKKIDGVIYSGSIVKLDRAIYTQNINEYIIKQLYPKTISLCYHNTEYFNQYEYYVYLIDNYKEIRNNLDSNEQFMFNIIINYQYAMIGRNNFSQMDYLMTGYTKIVEDLFEKDFYSDIIYFDTDSIYTAKTREIDKLINNHLKKLYNDIDIDYHNYGFFVQKKRYFLFDTEPKTIRGYDRKTNFYSDKQVKNTAYKLSIYDGNFKKFNRKNATDYVECKNKAKIIESRKNKLNNII